MKYQVDCRECYTEYAIEITEGEEAEEIVCCPFCGNVHPDFEKLEDE